MKKDTLEYFYTLQDDHIIFDAVNAVGDSTLDWAEFGTGRGELAARLHRVMPDNITLHTFDWFRGLPAPSMHGPMGAFACEIPKWILAADNIIIHEGLFWDTIPNFVQEFKRPLGLIIVDCDLYISTKTIFASIDKLVIPGTIIYFDEYYQNGITEKKKTINAAILLHEHRAFVEYIQQYNRKFEYLYRGPNQAIVRIIR